MSMGRHIKSFRKAAGLTQQSLADKAEVSRIYIQALESNRRLPSMHLLQKLAAALNVEVIDLVQDHTDKSGRMQLDNVLTSNEVELWYRSKKLTPSEVQRVQRVVQAVLGDWDNEGV